MFDFTLDHVVIGVRDLEAATADYRALLGRAPSWRGEHPKYGTQNTLFRIDNTYIELLSPGAKKRGRWSEELSKFLDRGEGLYALALGTYDADDAVKELRDRGLHVDSAADGDGYDMTTNARRSWRNALAPVKGTRGVRMFFIEHTTPPDALPPAAVEASAGAFVKRMDHAVVLSADMESTRHLWEDVLDARLALDRTFPERATRILFFRLRDITIEISGGARQTEEGLNKPDRLWGIAWGVDNLDATCARLREAGVDVSDARTGIKPGTRVATVKGQHAHGVATLLIGHTAESFRPESRLAQGEAYDNAPQRRAFNLTALHHVTLSASNADETARTWDATLGMKRTETIEAAHEPLRLSQLPAGNSFIELAQPLSQQHRIARAIAERGQGMYGIAVEVDDVDAAVADLRAKGVTVSDPEYGAWAGTRVARVDAKAANGVRIELVQRLPEVL